MRELLSLFCELGNNMMVLFPIHPRTRKRMEQFGLPMNTSSVRFMEPLSYLDFLALEARASVVITDSGGVQEETTYLGVPCLTVRDNTERPVTVHVGTNKLVGRNVDLLRQELERLNGFSVRPQVPPLWDGHAAERIAKGLNL
jgi:UDP-N-acetylglucosamine 2-epimerase (non-hydrolysing)